MSILNRMAFCVALLVLVGGIVLMLSQLTTRFKRPEVRVHVAYYVYWMLFTQQIQISHSALE